MDTLLLALVQLAAIGGLAVYLEKRARRTPPNPEVAPTAAPERNPDVPYVRRAELEADVAALTRRLASLEATVDERHQQVTGLIGQMRRQEGKTSASTKLEEANALLAAGLEARRAPAENHAPQLPPHVRRVKIIGQRRP